MRRRGAGPRSKYITPEGYERYRDELRFLWEEERPQVTQGVADAAAEGDRSENAEYIYGKKRLRAIDRRVRFLMKRLEELEVVENGARKSATKVFFGAWVRVIDDEEQERLFRIVGPDEHDMHPLYVSMDAPIGRCLLGKEEGDEAIIRRPKGDIEWEVDEVFYHWPEGVEPADTRPHGVLEDDEDEESD